jgi:hypothetical protein
MNKKPTVEKIETVGPPPSQLVGKDSVEDFVADRDRVLEHLKKGIREMRTAMKLAYDRGHEFMSVEVGDCDLRFASDEKVIASVRKELDSAIWQRLLEKSGYKSMLDAKAIDDLDRQMREEPHELTVENVYATLDGLRAMSPDLFSRGVVNVFRQLRREYYSNKSFRVNERIIFHLGSPSGYVYTRAANELDDVDRVFHLLDGRQPPEEYKHRLSQVVRQAWDDGKGQVETNYYKLKLYQNGNLHIYFKRRDLLDKVNQLIAKECGPVLADDSNAKEGVHAEATIRPGQPRGGES